MISKKKKNKDIELNDRPNGEHESGRGQDGQ